MKEVETAPYTDVSHYVFEEFGEHPDDRVIIIPIYFETTEVNKIIAEHLIILGPSILLRALELLDVIVEDIVRILHLDIEHYIIERLISKVANSLSKSVKAVGIKYTGMLVIDRWYNNSVISVSSNHVFPL